MSNSAYCRPDAPRGARRRSSTSIESGGFLAVREHLGLLGKTYENLQAGARHTDCTQEKMKRELNRLRSFERWPSASEAFRAELATAGLFYVGPKDRVQCFSCGGILKCRVFRASAMQEHRKCVPYCHFVMGREVGNIPKHQSVGRSPNLMDGLRRWSPESSRLLNKAARPDMAREWKREYSFSGWPKDKVLPSELARAGFYYVGYDDLVRCFYCSTGISNWKGHHDPWKRHAQSFPRCAFLKQEMGPDFIRAVQEQYCEGPQSPKADQQSTGRSTTPRLEFLGLGSSPAQPPDCAPSSQSLVAQSWLDDHLNSPLMQAVIAGHIEQTAQQMLQSALMVVKPWGSFTSLILPSDQEIMDFDMDNSCSEEPVSRNPSSVYASAKLEAAGPTAQDQLRQLKEERVCKICRDSQVSVVFVPCGHLVVCMGCAPRLKHCPICRASIEDTVHTFMS
ncbi:baculoviral IAP repeat-containing protein 7-like [Lissotriton helveticus]